MKYSPELKLFFVHVPKCAGLSVHRGLEPVADFPWAAFAADLGEEVVSIRARVTPFGFTHPALGEIHQAHIPLAVLSEHFPHVLSLLRNAEHSFAVLRDPRDRFLSALQQHLREFGGIGAVSITDKMLREHAKPICDWLSGHESFADLRYIHFTRQTDFLELDGKQVVGRRFAIENLAELQDWLVATAGTPRFLQQSRNRSRQPKAWFRPLQPMMRGAVHAVLPRPVHRRLHPLWMKSGVYREASKGYATVDLGTEIEQFIARRYAEDAILHAAARRD